MKYAYFGFGLLLFGCFGLVLIIMFQSITINNDSEYYNLKEAMKAAMIESVDMTCYRIDQRVRRTASETDECGSGKIKISEQKFVENFTRRFVATVGGNAKKYKIKFFDIIESPPKASVVIQGITDSYGAASNYESLTIMNSLTGILEQDKILKFSSKTYSVIDDSTVVIVNEPDSVVDESGSSSNDFDDALDVIDYSTNPAESGSDVTDDSHVVVGDDDDECSDEESCR